MNIIRTSKLKTAEFLNTTKPFIVHGCTTLI